jgi:hypothetical protein
VEWWSHSYLFHEAMDLMALNIRNRQTPRRKCCSRTCRTAQAAGAAELDAALDAPGHCCAGTGRYNVFDGDGSFITSMTRAAGVALGNPGVMTRRDELIDPSPVREPDGTSLLPIRLDTRTRLLDTLPPLRTRSIRVPAGPPPPAALGPYMPRVASTFDLDGMIWFAPTDSLAIYQRSPAGDTVRVIHWDRPARSLARHEDDSIAAIIARWR